MIPLENEWKNYAPNIAEKRTCVNFSAMKKGHKKILTPMSQDLIVKWRSGEDSNLRTGYPA